MFPLLDRYQGLSKRPSHILLYGETTILTYGNGVVFEFLLFVIYFINVFLSTVKKLAAFLRLSKLRVFSLLVATIFTGLFFIWFNLEKRVYYHQFTSPIRYYICTIGVNHFINLIFVAV